MLWGDVKTFCSDTRIKILSFICRREVSEIERERQRDRERDRERERELETKIRPLKLLFGVLSKSRSEQNSFSSLIIIGLELKND